MEGNQMNVLLSELESRTTELEQQFDNMADKVSRLEELARRLDQKDKINNISSCLLSTDQTSREVLDLLVIFFNVILNIVESGGATVQDLNDLWFLVKFHQNTSLFSVAVKSFGFEDCDVKHLVDILGIVHKNDSERFKKFADTWVQNNCKLLQGECIVNEASLCDSTGSDVYEDFIKRAENYFGIGIGYKDAIYRMILQALSMIPSDGKRPQSSSRI